MTILKKFLDTKAWIWLAKNVFAMVNFRVLGYPKFKLENFFVIANKVKESGSGIYCVMGADTKAASYKLEKFMTKATYSHVGLLHVTDPLDYSTYRFLHITSKGMALDHVLDYLREIDKVAVVKIPLDEVLVPFIYRDMNQYIENKSTYSYDFAFQFGTGKKLYCSELVYNILSSYTNKLKTSVVSGYRTITPDNIYQSGDVIYQAD
jgi:hypothetical protein